MPGLPAQRPGLLMILTENHTLVVRRLVRYGSGFHPFGEPTDEELARLDAELVAAGRDPAEVEMIGGTRAVFAGADGAADVDESIADFARQWKRGCTHVLHEAVATHRRHRRGRSDLSPQGRIGCGAHRRLAGRLNPP